MGIGMTFELLGKKNPLAKQKINNRSHCNAKCSCPNLIKTSELLECSSAYKS